MYERMCALISLSILVTYNCLLPRKCYEHALEIYEKLHGHKHNLIAAVLANLGVTWKYAGNNTKAVSLYQEALAIQEELYGSNHLEVSHLKIVHK